MSSQPEHSDLSLLPIQSKYHRLNSVILTLPGGDDPDKRLEMDQRDQFADAIHEIAQIQKVDAVEIKVFPYDKMLAYVVTPVVPTTKAELLGNTKHDRVEEYEEDESVVEISTTEKVAEILKDSLRKDIGVSWGGVDLRPVGRVPAITTRALVKKNRNITNINHTSALMRNLIRELYETNKPFILQTIIKAKNTKEYLTTIRYTVLHPAHTAMSKQEIIDHLKNKNQAISSRPLENVGLTTNQELPISDYIKIFSNRYELKTAKYKHPSYSGEVLKLFCGDEEYRDILLGRRGANSVYSDLDRYGVIPTAQVNLKHFCVLYPGYYDTSPWESVIGRNPPIIEIKVPEQDAEATPYSLGTRTVSIENNENAPMTEGTIHHQTGVAFAVDALNEKPGYQARVVSQASGESFFDGLVSRPDDEPALEFEKETQASKAGGVLVNRHRALYQGRPVIFVGATKRAAEKIGQILTEPFSTRSTTRARLYNKMNITLPGGKKPVLPKGYNEAYWWLEGDRLSLETADGEELASGPADSPLRELDWDCPMLKRGDSRDEYEIVGAKGGVIQRGSKDHLRNEFTTVKGPVVPSALQLLDDIEIRYVAGDELRPLDPIVDWDTSKQDSEYYKEGIEYIIDTYLVEDEEAEISYTSFQEMVQRLFDAGAAKTPNETWIGRIAGDLLDIDPPNVAERKINGVKWLFEPGLYSPQYPFIDDGWEDATTNTALTTPVDLDETDETITTAGSDTSSVESSETTSAASAADETAAEETAAIAEWARDAESKTSLYEAGIEVFLDERTEPVKYELISYDEFLAAVQAFFDANAPATPPANWIGRLLPGTVDVDSRGKNERYVHHLRLVDDEEGDG